MNNVNKIKLRKFHNLIESAKMKNNVLFLGFTNTWIAVSSKHIFYF